jgi:uncharacterized membrane protein YphA (DoxX/SURF4 family)
MRFSPEAAYLCGVLLGSSEIIKPAPPMPSSITMPSTAAPSDEPHILHTIQTTLRLTFGIVPIVAGLDKFTNFLTNWEQYLNPNVMRFLPLSPVTFMHLVGIIEVIAGAIVLAKPRVGAFIVMAWLIAIALQLLVGWMFVDIAVRDLVMAISALTLARLTPVAERHATPPL